MSKGPKGQRRPTDVIGRAVQIMRIAIGEEAEDLGSTDDGKAPLRKSDGQDRVHLNAYTAVKTIIMRNSALALCAIGGVSVAGLGLAKPAQADQGWQGVRIFNVPTGQVNQQIGYDCPQAYPIASNGSLAMNAAGQTSQVFLSFNGTRIDIPHFGEWAWHFFWPAGAPAGISISLGPEPE